MKILNKDQKITVMKSALEQLKDAPLLDDERDQIITEALYFVDWGNYDLNYQILTNWGTSIIKTVFNNEEKMANYRYGTITVNDDPGGYEPVTDDTYEVDYHTVSDFLSVVRNGETDALWGYFGSRAVGKMITTWYLTYVLEYDMEFVENLFKKRLSLTK